MTESLMSEQTLFKSLSSQETGITFRNDLIYDEQVNVYTFRNFYNGAGVAIGDLNNDGLSDIFFCGNQVDNELYINKGRMQFFNATKSAGVSSENVWSTGVCLVDINADGWLDIYVSKSGDIKGENRHNELFINKGIIRSEDGVELVAFDEQSEEYGLDDVGLSTHAAFFDYDLDGDLDCYLLNNSFKSVGNYDLKQDQRLIRDEDGGNKLFKNHSSEGVTEGQTIFTDVSEAAGIYGSAIGFGLGVTIGDVDVDGWPDIFVSNDFFEKDYLYINNQDGTFTESVDDAMGEISMGSMGADLADINNDGLPDLFVTEMLPRDETRLKTKAQFQNWNAYQANEKAGYHRQFARNVLQVNLGDGQFAEAGRLAGVEATDWSWGALIFDMDGDGYKDIFVANGIYKDLLDQDYINFYANPAEVRKILFDKENGGIIKLIDKMPSEAVSNFSFKNLGDGTFRRVEDEWGLSGASFSNGSAYGDLDNDGDLDLVVSNINMPSMVFENRCQEINSVQVQLTDSTSLNRRGLGAKVFAHIKGKQQYLENYNAKGFMSSVDDKLTFALEKGQQLDSLIVIWPGGKVTKVLNPPSGTLVKIDKGSAVDVIHKSGNSNRRIFKESKRKLAFTHVENDYSDFDREPLKYTMQSNYGPACCNGDINNDGLMDVYIGGANGQAGQLFLQNKNGTFSSVNTNVFDKHKDSEDVDCKFFNANGDPWADLYVVSGSTEFGGNNVALADRLYLSNGGKDFELSNQILPSFKFENTSSVSTIDYDGDGDEDLVVSGFVKSYLYGLPSDSYILENDGKGKFQNVTKVLAPQFSELGMVSDLAICDIDNDGVKEIVVCGEWMGIECFEYDGEKFTKNNTALSKLSGFWNTIVAADLDNDGDQDFIVGNSGTNTRYKATKEHPLNLYVNDFDQNGRPEQIITYQNNKGEYPFAQRMDLLKQMPILNKAFPNFKSYASKSITEIIDTSLLNKSIVKSISELRTGIIWNEGKYNFRFEALPYEAQLSPTFAILTTDANDDGNMDIVLGGNQYRSKPELGINDASYGLLLLSDGNKNFIPMKPQESGINIKGEIREIVNLGSDIEDKILFVRNNNTSIILEKSETVK